VSCHKLRVSTNSMIFRITDQKLWVFEVSGQCLARVGMCLSHPTRIDHLRKKWRAREKKILKKGTVCPCPSVDPRPSATSGSPPAAGRHLDKGKLSHSFEIFYFFEILFWKFGEWTRAFGRTSAQHPHFLKLAPTLGSVKSCKLHGGWRFHFFSNFIFHEFRVHIDLHIYRWDFCFMKK
jgi:hypothetical protein